MTSSDSFRSSRRTLNQETAESQALSQTDTEYLRTDVKTESVLSLGKSFLVLKSHSSFQFFFFHDKQKMAAQKVPTHAIGIGLGTTNTVACAVQVTRHYYSR